jgi:hypothetical protein
MTFWGQRSREERDLLNPAFCANLLWHAAGGYSGLYGESISFEESFLVLPFVLHRETREELPRSTRTSLAVWLDEHPLARGRVTSRARLLVPFTKEAMIFGGVHGFIRLDGGMLHADMDWKRSVVRALKESSDEVRVCAKRASFIGKWFAESGSPATVLSLVGVCP